MSILPNVPQVAIFDTAYHHTLDAVHYLYSIPYKYYKDYAVRKYGAHGTSVNFKRSVSTDAVTGEKTYGDWSAAQSFAAVKSPELKGYTPDQAEIGTQPVNVDSKNLAFKVAYTKTPVAGGNVTAKYVDENGNPIAYDVIASGNVGDTYSTTQKDVPGYTFKEVQGKNRNSTGSFTDQDQTVTYVYTKNPATMAALGSINRGSQVMVRTQEIPVLTNQGILPSQVTLLTME